NAPAQTHVDRGDVVGRAQRIDVIERAQNVAVECRDAASRTGAATVKHLYGYDSRVRCDAAGAAQHAGAPRGDAGHMRAVPARQAVVRARRPAAWSGALYRPARAVRDAARSRVRETCFGEHLAGEKRVGLVDTGIEDRNGLTGPARAFGPCLVGARNARRVE